MRYLSSFVFILLIISCGSKSTQSVPGGINLTGFTTTKVDNSDIEYAYQQKADGAMLAEGMLKNGLQHGQWITYFPEEANRIQTIANYVNGKINGPYIEMNNRSQVEKRTTYLNDKIHGLYSEYKFGRPLKEFMYDEGVLNGISKEYNDRGQLIKETSYKNGELHGSIVQYDEGGNEVLRYEYKNGKKISGGIVEK